MSEALEIYKHLQEMTDRARGEVQLSRYQGLPLQEAAAISQVKALSVLDNWIMRKYHIRRCYDCGELVQLTANVDGPVSCQKCIAAEEPPELDPLDDPHRVAQLIAEEEQARNEPTPEQEQDWNEANDYADEDHQEGDQ